MTIAAIIEWPLHEAPALIMSKDLDFTCKTVVEVLRDEMVEDGYEDDPHFIENHPFPDTDDPAAVRRWLLAMREATTVPWVELYIYDGPRCTNMPLTAILSEEN